VKKQLLIAGFLLLSACLLASALLYGQEDNSSPPSNTQTPSATVSPSAAANTAYRLTAWGELGMHCMDGKDYSIFAVLPPYNTIRAQLVQMGANPVPITTGVTITYQAVADATGSINTISSTKTNFWSYVKPLFLQRPAPEMGLDLPSSGS
jgi:hypothetical protein